MKIVHDLCVYAELLYEKRVWVLGQSKWHKHLAPESPASLFLSPFIPLLALLKGERWRSETARFQGKYHLTNGSTFRSLTQMQPNLTHTLRTLLVVVWSPVWAYSKHTGESSPWLHLWQFWAVYFVLKSNVYWQCHRFMHQNEEVAGDHMKRDGVSIVFQTNWAL